MRWISLGLLSLFLIPAPAEAAIRIGYVDLRKALNSVEDGIAAKKRLKMKKSSFQKKLSRLQKQLKRAKKSYDSRAAILRGNAKRKMQARLQKKFLTLQRTYTKLTRSLAREESVETRKIFRKMEVIIRRIAKENKLYLMLEKTESSVLYATPSMDYTNELIRRYNRLFAGKGKKRKRRRRKRRRKKRR
tara:strand:- start:4477 stop:5043 length:567 start_codon:yes stop_codon:yes gene_type:complete